MARDSKLPKQPNPGLGSVSAQIYTLLRENPDGLSITEIRRKLGVGENQEHLDRRIRDLRKFYILKGSQQERGYVYTLEGLRPASQIDVAAISGRLRAEILHRAKGRCQQCGETIAEHGITLQLDHRLPLSWGGQTTPENLWAICERCNNGKRDYFKSFDEGELKDIISFPSVYERIARTLKMHSGKPVPSQLLEFVANANDVQDDWQKRLRELRYPVIGLDISATKIKNAEGKLESAYTLNNWRDLPPNHKQLIKEYERKNRGR